MHEVNLKENSRLSVQTNSVATERLVDDFEKKLAQTLPVISISKIKAPTLRVFFTAPEILFSHSYCIATKAPALLIKCSQIYDMFVKMYHFDSMLRKLMNAVAIIIHQQDLKLVFTNDLEILKLFSITRGSQIRIQYDSKRNCVAFDISKYKAKITPGKSIDWDTTDDDLYDDIAAGLVSVVIHKTNYTVNQNKYRVAVDHVLQNIIDVDSYKVKAGISNMHLKACDLIDVIDSYNLDHFKTEELDLDSIAAVHAIASFCRKIEYNNTLLMIEPYALMVNGFSIDHGTTHYNLPYVQPMVNYIKDDFEPFYTHHIESICDGSSHISYQNNRGKFFISDSDFNEHDMLFHGTKASLLGCGITTGDL